MQLFMVILAIYAAAVTLLYFKKRTLRHGYPIRSGAKSAVRRMLKNNIYLLNGIEYPYEIIASSNPAKDAARAVQILEAEGYIAHMDVRADMVVVRSSAFCSEKMNGQWLVVYRKK